MYNNFFTICSLFYIIMLSIVYFNRKNINTIETKLYSILVITNLCNVIFAILCYFTILNKNYIPFINNFISKTLLVIFFIYGLVFSIYVLLITSKNKENFTNKLKLIKTISIILLAMIGITAYTLPLEYFNENKVVYSYGAAANLIYGSFAFFVGIWVIRIISNFQVIKDKKIIPIISFIVLIAIAVTIQKANPGLLLTTATGTFVTVLMYFTIENPDMKLLNEVHKAKEISDNANEEKTLFLYNMTQEIRNISSKITNEANFILDESGNDNVNDSARNILSHTSSFNAIMNDILDVSSLEASNLKIYNEKYNIKILLKELINSYNKICANKEIKFITNIEQSIPEYLFGDSISLKEVLNTVLNNSVKYTRKGFVEFNLNTIIKGDICRFIFTIDDSGAGIKSEKINEILTGDSTIGKANKIITVMNGTMMMSSEYGVGTKIKIILDQKIAEINNNQTKEYDELISDKKILVIDDSEASIKIIEKILKDKDIIIDSSMNGKDAINKVKANKYDLILLDEELSMVKATDLMNKFNTIRNFNTKVILLTKDSSTEYKEDYIKDGFVDYIIKPIKKEEIIKKISDYTK